MHYQGPLASWPPAMALAGQATQSEAHVIAIASIEAIPAASYLAVSIEEVCLFVLGVLIIGSLPFGICTRAPEFCRLPFWG